MRNIIVLFGLLLAVTIFSCSTDPVGSNIPQDSGKILLKIDKQNAPASVLFVKAFLTRENRQPINGNLNLQSDSTADILLDNIDAGEWHLKVDAEDDSGIVLYTGETDVQIFAGFTSQVYLTLYPTGSGTGSIYINVTWGVPFISNWIDYMQNPILSKSDQWWEALGISQGKVLFEDGIYKMWYLALSSGPYATVCYATSPDGIVWTKHFNNPVLSPTPGTWDQAFVGVGSVLKEDGVYKMYYTGFETEYSSWNIGMATSSDGINWTKMSNPVLYAGVGWENQLTLSSVVKKDNIYYLFYTGRNSGQPKIGLATSSDGINWTKHPGNPILQKDANWEGAGIYYPSVIYENNAFKMVYMNANGFPTAFGMATSTDGINWAKSPSNPFFTEQQTANNWADDHIAYPNFIKVNNEYRIYYSGIGDNSIVYKIGFMRKQAN
jgi:beta-1,2-mannobiose phosphorylase / 1,2-beta-oligomannan phosphorylase